MFGIGFPEIIIILVIVPIYCLPSIVAKMRNHKDFNSILILNILFGWVGVGWIVALVWALTNGNFFKRGDTIIEATMKKCPFCAEYIKKEALFCRFCKKELEKENHNV